MSAYKKRKRNLEEDDETRGWLGYLSYAPQIISVISAIQKNYQQFKDWR